MQLTSAPETEEPETIINTPLPVLESEVLAFAGCSGGNVELARARVITRTADKLQRLRILAADSASTIDEDLATAQALLVSAAESIVTATNSINDLATALAARAGLLRAADGDIVELAADQSELADHALELSGERIAYLNARIAALPARIASSQAEAAGLVDGIRAMISGGGVDIVALVAEIYSATDRIPGGSFFADQRVTRTDVEAGRYELPPE